MLLAFVFRFPGVDFINERYVGKWNTLWLIVLRYKQIEINNTVQKWIIVRDILVDIVNLIVKAKFVKFLQ